MTIENQETEVRRQETEERSQETRRRQKEGQNGGEYRKVPTQRQPAKNFRDLVVWQKAHQFVLSVYPFTARFPREETYRLAIQMRRAAVSIAANICEGFRKRGKADKARFMNTAEGSIEECRYYLILAQDLGYGETEGLMETLEGVSRLLDSYSKAILASVF